MSEIVFSLWVSCVCVFCDEFKIFDNDEFRNVLWKGDKRREKEKEKTKIISTIWLL